eukprot:CAMPEP_0171344168 /NCGR_PEP_ID=MMETSP0878-20121228/18814_1 /TAXON_ID=67004 /ORGANISM="Thalassiosira weissflogii, Strain CCMP1336" /LENGTH=215 /DNA_ID=CAMNT_0011847293 /DNA_START=182 /DNA_END=829 /DNA_ORIENTATION=-
MTKQTLPSCSNRTLLLLSIITIFSSIVQIESFSDASVLPTKSSKHANINIIKPAKTHITVAAKNADSRLNAFFSDLISDDDEDLRPRIDTIAKQQGLENFLKVDDRLCLIKIYAPFCKACKAFGVKFRRLASEKGDRMNSAGHVVHPGIIRFGEIEYSSNIKLCRALSVKKFPIVLLYRGGADGGERLSEIFCRSNAVEDILVELDQLMVGGKQN